MSNEPKYFTPQGPPPVKERFVLTQITDILAGFLIFGFICGVIISIGFLVYAMSETTGYDKNIVYTSILSRVGVGNAFVVCCFITLVVIAFQLARIINLLERVLKSSSDQ